MLMVAMAVTKVWPQQVKMKAGGNVLVHSVKIGSVKTDMVRIVVVGAVALMNQDDGRHQDSTRKPEAQNIHTQKQVSAEEFKFKRVQ
jgi:hypothetical protein